MNTRYPIILVHGLAVRDCIFMKPFGQIERILKIEGFNVNRSKVDAFATIEHNAESLKEEILKICEEHGVDKVNIIAHSKGGLDARYMIEKLDMADHVASLTTLCTPHKGSVFARGFIKLPRWMLKFMSFFVNLWYRILGDKRPNSFKSLEQLSSFNPVEEETILLGSGIYCQSYSATLERSRDDFVLGIPLAFCHYFEKGEPCDGLVTNESAKFGEYKGNMLEGSISHSDVFDFMAKKKKKDRIYAFYSSLCEDLKGRGF